MCDCRFQVHHGIDCGGDGCYCHDDNEWEQQMDKVYLTISFYKIDRSKAEEVVKAAMAIAGPIDVSVNYDTVLDDEN